MQGLVEVPVGLRILCEPLVGARNIENDVAIGDETVGSQKVLQGFPVVSLLVGLRCESEMQIGFVCKVVGNRPRGSEQRRYGEQQNEKTGPASAVTGGGGADRRRSVGTGSRPPVGAEAEGVDVGVALGSGTSVASTRTSESECPCDSAYGR
jgi:hypothetical protein